MVRRPPCLLRPFCRGGRPNTSACAPILPGALRSSWISCPCACRSLAAPEAAPPRSVAVPPGTQLRARVFLSRRINPESLCIDPLHLECSELTTLERSQTDVTSDAQINLEKLYLACDERRVRY